MLESGRRKSLYEQATEMEKKSPKMMFVCVWVRGGGGSVYRFHPFGAWENVVIQFYPPCVVRYFFHWLPAKVSCNLSGFRRGRGMPWKTALL